MSTKKLNRVETPIDQRETFVSIQKNFADSDISVEEKLRTLYELQKADTEIDKILQLRGELPEEVENLEAEVEELKAKAVAYTSEIEALNLAISENKQNILDCDNLISKYQKQIENISNSREYDSINKEIENQDLLRQIAEKNINEAKMRISSIKDAIEDLKADTEIRTSDLQAKQAELDNIVEATSKEEKALVAQRNACAKKIDERTMSAYNRIRASVNNHLAVVTMYNNNSCGGCFSTVIPQRIIEINSNKKLVICENCGRIIVSSNMDEVK